MADTTAAVGSAPIDTSTTSDAPEIGSGSNNGVTDKVSDLKNPSTQALNRFKIKVDGKDEDVDLDTLKREYSKSRGADKRFEEAHKMRQQSEEFIRLLKQDPRRVLTDPRIGVDMRRLAEDYLREQIESDMLDPKEKQLREMQRKLQQAEEESKNFKQQQEQERVQALTTHYQQEYDKTIAEALSTAGLPKTPRTVSRMAALMERNLEYGYELQPKDLVEQVRRDYVGDIMELFGATDGDTLLAILGDDITNKIRQSDLKRLRGVTGAKAPAASKQVSRGKQEAPSKHISIYDWRDQLEKKFGK